MVKEIQEKENEKSSDQLEDLKINVRIILAVFWICHFLLWTFGDMMSLLQEQSDPIKETVFLFIAPTTAVVQALMIVFCLLGPVKYVRIVNFIVAPVYLLFNIGYLGEPDSQAWNYYLGIVYILFNLLIIWYAWNWPKQKITPKK
jgi:hypothetical protein